MQNAVPRCLAGDMTPFLDDIGVQLLRTYFDPEAKFSGAAFDTFAGGGDAIARRHTFTTDDLVATTLLDVDVPGHAALAILDGRTSEFSGLLTQIPVDVELWDAPSDVSDDSSAAAELWRCLKALPGVGWVTASKLMARKRPRLLPVYDSVVKAALQPDERSFWLPLRLELQDGTLVERLRYVREDAGLSERIPLLRVLDVAIWMRNRRASTCQLHFRPCPHWA